MFVTKAFPGRCCGVAAVSKRLFKAPETRPFNIKSAVVEVA